MTQVTGAALSHKVGGLSKQGLAMVDWGRGNVEKVNIGLEEKKRKEFTCLSNLDFSQGQI